jgi:uncharacterized membrane protein
MCVYICVYNECVYIYVCIMNVCIYIYIYIYIHQAKQHCSYSLLLLKYCFIFSWAFDKLTAELELKHGGNYQIRLR